MTKKTNGTFKRTTRQKQQDKHNARKGTFIQFILSKCDLITLVPTLEQLPDCTAVLFDYHKRCGGEHFRVEVKYFRYNSKLTA